MGLNLSYEKLFDSDYTLIDNNKLIYNYCVKYSLKDGR